MDRWFVKMDGETVGPVVEDTVARAIETGRVLATTPVCKEGADVWQDAQSVPRFAEVLGGVGSRTGAGQVGRTSFETSGALGQLVGQGLAGFRLTNLIGEGGMAVVFRGENTLDATITRAIKVVLPELSANPEFVPGSLRRPTLERLQHPNVVRFYGLRRERGLLIIGARATVRRGARDADEASAARAPPRGGSTLLDRGIGRRRRGTFARRGAP